MKTLGRNILCMYNIDNKYTNTSFRTLNYDNLSVNGTKAVVKIPQDVQYCKWG